MPNSFSYVRGHDLGPTACFSVTAVSDPSTLPRVLEVFAKLGRVPHQCHATAYGVENEDLHIDLQFTTMDALKAEQLARALRGCVLVKTVLTSQKTNRMIA